jgi:FAD/FMN-containing dehydrogenase
MISAPTRELSGWGRYPKRPGPVQTIRSEVDLRAAMRDGGVVARGNGRAYGDAAIGSARTLDMRRMNRMISFDADTGRLVVETGVLLGDVIEAFLPRGWFPLVTPGTKFVTIGGAIAADVHGKNHHRDGSFGACVDWVEVMGTDGTITRASKDGNSDLFAWTVGGMGLTGVIVRAAIRLRPVESGWIVQRTVPAANLTAAMEAFERADEATYSVAWIDCLADGEELGRSLLMLGEHAGAGEVPRDFRRRPFETPRRHKLRVPFDAPTSALNRYSVKAFNALYWAKGMRGAGLSTIDWDAYFYPLDAILEWNRIYGRHGFLQFQCVLPPGRAEAGLRALLKETARTEQGSFLAVLKRFGPQDSHFSFPTDGYTLALDFPANAKVLALLDRLDVITVEHGGRFYLAKDARMAAATLHRADPRAAEMRRMRTKNGLDEAFASAQSERLMI